jgi:ribosomal protein S27E
MQKDKGGWSSKGMPVICPKCRESGTMIESQIYGKTSYTMFCRVCAHDWIEHESDEDDDRD